METLLLQPWNPTQTLWYLPTHFSVYLLSCQLVIYTLWKGMSGFISAVKALLKMFSKTTERAANGSQDSTVQNLLRSPELPWGGGCSEAEQTQRVSADNTQMRLTPTQSRWCNDIKANLQIENRSRVLALVLGGGGGPRALRGRCTHACF